MGIAWNELVSPDTARSRDFYTGLLGWTTREMPMPGGGGTYTLFLENGSEIAGMMAPPNPETQAPVWFTYVAVDDVDAAAEKASALGGAVVRPPFDIPGYGRVAIIADPTGAAVGLFKAAG